MTNKKSLPNLRTDVSAVFRTNSFFLIAGPCVLENEVLHEEIAATLCEIQETYGIPVIFKASFDKANRTSWQSPRGPGVEDGMEMLAAVQKEFNLPVLTDIHESWQAAHAAQVCDVLQIPAALSRQTELLWAAAATNLPITIKKGQWMSVAEAAAAVAKVRSGPRNGSYPLAVIERGTFFGYGDLVVDMRNIRRLQMCDAPVIFDGTHTVQRPADSMDDAFVVSSGGNREFIPTLVYSAVAAGADGLYIEVHPTPDKAPSDGDAMLSLNNLVPLIKQVLALRRALGRKDGVLCPTCGGLEGSCVKGQPCIPAKKPTRYVRNQEGYPPPPLYPGIPEAARSVPTFRNFTLENRGEE